MDSQGRIQCALIATASGHIIYERFYERFSDVEKADIRSCFQRTQEKLMQNKIECTGRLRCEVLRRAESSLQSQMA